MRLRALDERTLVAGQISPTDVAELAMSGIATIVNNRPDGEEPGQPAGGEIAAAARAAGLDYRDLPIAGGFPSDRIEGLARTLGETQGRVLLFCRSGTRSAWLWALAQRSRGADGETLIAQAAAAGYDLSPLRPYLVR